MNNLEENINNLETTLKFIEKTKNGEYAVIDEVSVNIGRFEEETIVIDTIEEEYYYSIS